MKYLSYGIMAIALCVSNATGDQYDQLLLNLRHDKQRWNAIESMRELAGSDIPIKRLERCLDSDDWQQRQYACVLRWKFLRDQEPRGVVTTRLLEVSVEALGDDRMPHDDRTDPPSHMWCWNATTCFYGLVENAREAREPLEFAFRNGDHQQRFLCAVILGLGGVAESVDLVAPYLLEHLKDNEIPEDAKFSLAALHGFGVSARPYLLPLRNSDDRQQKDSVRLLLLANDKAVRNDESRDEIARFNRVTSAAVDPLSGELWRIASFRALADALRE